MLVFCLFKQKTAYEMRISDWSSDVCSSDLDRYFEYHPQANFRDLDVFAAGPVVGQVAETFDAFWDSAWSRSIRAIDRGRWRLADVRATVRRGLRRRIRQEGNGLHPQIGSASCRERVCPYV